MYTEPLFKIDNSKIIANLHEKKALYFSNLLLSPAFGLQHCSTSKFHALKSSIVAMEVT
jgi:hypothetical protein